MFLKGSTHYSQFFSCCHSLFWNPQPRGKNLHQVVSVPQSCSASLVTLSPHTLLIFMFLAFFFFNGLGYVLSALIQLLLFQGTLCLVLGLVFFKKLMFAQQLQHKSNVRRHNSYKPVSLGACTPIASLYSHPSCHLFTAILTHRLELAQECLPVLKSYIQFPAHRLLHFVCTILLIPTHPEELFVSL